MGRVAESQAPFWVKTGMRSWNARRVPEGRSLARLAVPSKVWEMARCEKDFWRSRGALIGVSGSVSDERGDGIGGAGLSAVDD